mgnify:CR=1 FL=1
MRVTLIKIVPFLLPFRVGHVVLVHLRATFEWPIQDTLPDLLKNKQRRKRTKDAVFYRRNQTSVQNWNH